MPPTAQAKAPIRVQPRLLRRTDVADYLGISPRQFDYLRQKAGFPPPDCRLGPQTPRWDRLTVDNWIEGHKASRAGNAA